VYTDGRQIEEDTMEQEQQYEWAVEVTREDLDSEGAVIGRRAGIWLGVAESERQARARFDAITDVMARAGEARFQRVAAARLVRRPVSVWEEA
jgi:hypothetical protein